MVAGSVTLLGVAIAVAPSAFRAHLAAAEPGPLEPALLAHADEALVRALGLSLAVALPVAVGTGLAVTWLIAHRLTTSIAAVALAAERIAAGDLDARVAAPAIGPEVGQLVAAFNAMADRLAETEAVRQRLIADVAHELRTPVASIEATVEAVVDGVLPPDAQTLATLRDQTERLDRLVSDMAAVSRADEGRLGLVLAPVPLADVAGRAVAGARAAFANAGVDLVLDVAEPAPVNGDAVRLVEVVAGLLENALRHTPAGGCVSVGVRTDGAEGLVEVTDTGSGFPPSTSDLLFERFYRGDVSRSRVEGGGGSGIGLTIARAVVEAHGGRLTATSSGPGTGATFRLRLPRRDGESSRP